MWVALPLIIAGCTREPANQGTTPVCCAAITIAAVDDFARNRIVYVGSGTQEDPYRIENLTIDGSRQDFALVIHDPAHHYQLISFTSSHPGTRGAIHATVASLYVQDVKLEGPTDFALVVESRSFSARNLLVDGAASALHLRVDRADIENSTFHGFRHYGLLIEGGRLRLLNSVFESQALSSIGVELNAAIESEVKRNRVRVGAACLTSNGAANVVELNRFEQCTSGVVLQPSSAQNSVFMNAFAPGVDAIDSGTQNVWNQGEQGNYWSDSIGEGVRQVPPNGTDYHPLGTPPEALP